MKVIFTVNIYLAKSKGGGLQCTKQFWNLSLFPFIFFRTSSVSLPESFSPPLQC